MTQPLDYRGSAKDHRIPTKTATVGMWLFLASLTMLFGASMLAYIMIRLFSAHSGELQRIDLSPIFWVSTIVVMLGSLTIQFAVTAIRREHQGAARQWIWVTFALSILFCVVQTPGLIDLWHQHAPRSQGGGNLAKLIASFIVLHALHVAGGVLALTIVAIRATRHRYDHENYLGIKHAAMYWHFLDIVWAVMFSTMLIFG